MDQSVAGLVQDGKIVPVRLALFAEMVKGKPWTPATLRDVGGTQGVGLTFLEETFGASTAPPEHRLHQGAAQAVLKALLPASGTDIKGEMRSRQGLLEASGYADRPTDFEDLLRILDPELRLITPTSPEGPPTGGQQATPSGRYYQLTHDYLVHSLRDWLTRKQRETRRGRAELRLAERSAAWNARPENRQLPSLLEWAGIRSLTRKKDWTRPQRRMMKRAGWIHGRRTLTSLVLLGLLAWGSTEGYGNYSGRRGWWRSWRRLGRQTYLRSSGNSATTVAGWIPVSRPWSRVATTIVGRGCTPASPCCRSMPPSSPSSRSTCSMRPPSNSL